MSQAELHERIVALLAELAPDAEFAGMSRAQGGYDLRVRANGILSGRHFLPFKVADETDGQGTQLIREALSAALAEIQQQQVNRQ
ncbi:MAG: hypothetical protein HY660_06530 [Armatimonadetes bacterium]|nr:hypothetical protein [Armatimonadota bacterium]